MGVSSSPVAMMATRGVRCTCTLAWPAAARAAIAAGLDPFVDVWLGETLSTIAEMRMIVDTVAAAGAARPIWISFAVPDRWPDGHPALRSGESMQQIVDAITADSLAVSVIMINCSTPEQTGPALADLRSAIDAAGLTIETGAYANAFPTEREEHYAANEVIFERRPELTAERYAEFVASWIEGGTTLVGGCCDMYPEHIAALASRFG